MLPEKKYPTNDERFAKHAKHDHYFNLWLRQDQSSRAGQWIAAGAAGALGEACAVLSRSNGIRWRLCHGYMDVGLNMYYSISPSGMPVPVRIQDAPWINQEKACKDRRILQAHFFDSWIMNGGPKSVKYWCFPFLEPEPPS